jgi:hypothetical protein
VHLVDGWSANTKFIEFDPPDGCVAAELIQRGLDRYLAVVGSAGRRAELCNLDASRSRHVAVADGRLPIRQNNADVLILSGRAGWRLARFRDFRHAESVAWRPNWGFAACLMALACLVQLVLRRIQWLQLVSFKAGTGTTWLLVFHVRKRRIAQAARRYLPYDLGIRGLIERLGAARIRYAVLRWFESLPDLAPGEDLDLLIEDAALEKIHALLDSGPGIQPCDVYSVTGLPGADYKKMPYFPPHLAAALLFEAQAHSSGALVPSLRHHFLSLAYHAIYHKGARSGLPSRDRTIPEARNPEHDYRAMLAAIAQQLGISVSLTREDLDEYLRGQGWRPPRDMLVRLATGRRDLKSLVGDHHRSADDPGLTVFLIRQAAVERGRLTQLVELIEHEGFQILETKLLTPAESQSVGRTIRGGNWGRGPWPASGGFPAAVVVAYDAEPIPVSRQQRRRFPELANARLLCKSKLRDLLNCSLPRDLHCNALHSSDNGSEALEYIQVTMPGALPRIRAQVARIRDQYKTTEPVLLQLSSYRRRAKSEVIEFDGQLAVKKTFKPHQRSYCRREAWAMRQLSRQVSAIPPLLATDGESVIYPYYDDVLKFRRSSGKLLPLEVARQAIAALHSVYEAGFALIDAHPENLIVDRRHGLKLIDFEFLYKYEQQPATFAASYDIAGCPADFPGSQPDGGAKCYARHWQPYIGLSLNSLLHDPPWLQQLKRGLYCLRRAPWLLPRRVRDWLLGWSHMGRPRPTMPAPVVHTFPKSPAMPSASRRVA